ncbi:MAG: hypothetical protein HDT38_00330 [Clostridiales bacterium]|nr:hypothetical protein [Clostridiales bacterium]
MPVRNGLLSTLRAKGRAALFTLLILTLTVTLALGLGMWAYCGALLAQMEEQYTSVALVEYMGENYPDEDTADDAARAALAALDDGALSTVDGVKLWERAESTLVSIDGYRRPGGNSPYRDNAVVVATITPEYGTGRGQVDEADLPAARAVLHFELDGEVKMSPEGYPYQDQYAYYTFYLPGQEPLTLPYYYLDDETGLYRRYWAEDSLSEEPPEGAYVLRHAIPDQSGIQWWINSITGELPEGYDQYARDFEDNYYPYFRSFMERLLNGAPEWPVYEYYEDYDGEANVYFSNHETVLSGSFGRVSSALYSSYGTGSMSCYFDVGTTDFLPERGKLYLLHGAFVAGGGARTFQVQPFPNGGGDPWLELSGEDDPALTGSVFTDYAELYRLSNNTAVLTASDNISALELFQQGTLYLADGRFPQAGERGVCVISGSMSENLGLGVGDTLDLQILESDPELRAAVSATGDRRTLEIVGVTNPQTDYATRLWVSAAEGDFSSPPFGYLLGMAVLDNQKAAQAAEELSSQLPLLVQLTLYDQGYAAAARPIQAMETAAQAITLAAAFGALAVLVLFAFLFVGRQRETVGVLVSLGTPAGKIRLWLLSGAAAISGAAALLGAAVGALTLGRVTAAAMAMAERLYATDTRYSEASTGIVKEWTATDAIPSWPAPAAGGMVFLAALALCLVFLRHARKENAPKRGKVSVRVPKGRTSVAGRGSLRFAVLSARRGGRRSVVVVAAALVLTLFVSLLAASTQGWSRQMDELYDSSRLQGQVISLNGRKQTNLVIPARDIQAMWKSDYLEDISVSLGWHYERPPGGKAAPRYYDASYFTSMGGESEANRIGQLPTLSAVNSLSAAAEFYYTDRPEIQWLDGWDESFLADTSHPSALDGIYPCLYERETQAPDYVYPVLVGSRFLENSGLGLGDTLDVKLYMSLYIGSGNRYIYSGEAMVEWPLSLQIVGSFTSTGAKDNFYVPLSLWCGPEWLRGDGDAELAERESGRIDDMDSMKRWVYFRTRFETCRFTLKSAYELEDLRGWLAGHEYSQVGVVNRNRVAILLRDESFVDAVGGLGRYISFSRILFPVLFLVVGLLGFIISWLTVSSRRMELAVMRGLGASPGRAFASFFLEQAALCLTGCLIGVLVMSFQYPGAVWLAGAGFLVCYLAGCALSVLTAGRTNLMLLLSERE